MPRFLIEVSHHDVELACRQAHVRLNKWAPEDVAATLGTLLP